MVKLRALVIAVAALAVVSVAAGCGGSTKAPAEKQANDPASVPSSTPLANAPIYYIVGDTISMKGGATATIGATNATPNASSSQTYTVASGDTCYGIAAQFGITIDQLYRANGGENGTCASLSVGNVMHIPGQTATATPSPGSGGASNGTTPKATATSAGSSSGQTYTVQAGDTCYGIATTLGVDPEKFVAANTAACNNLHQGDTLHVP